MFLVDGIDEDDKPLGGKIGAKIQRDVSLKNACATLNDISTFRVFHL